MTNKKQTKIAPLREELIALNKAYRNGTPKVSDAEYDRRVEELRAISPDDEFFKKGVVEEATDRMEKLPMPMFSLEKIKTIKELRKWLQKMLENGAVEVVATPKFDGISLLTYDRNGDEAWTRGDGEKGQRSDSHFSKMNNGKMRNAFCNVYTWGEAICKKNNFNLLKEELGLAYKNARNMVAGIFNSPDGDSNPALKYVDFVRYGISEQLNKDAQLRLMRNRYHNVAPSKGFFIEEILELNDEELNEFIDVELHDDFDDEYKIDGIVIEVNELEVREKLGRLPNGNPAYAIAFKRDEWCEVYQTKVTGFEFGVGKTGAINPVILVEPTEINGATVSRVTGYNMAYMYDNHICIGALIEITRGGDVIPKHLKTIEYSELEFEQMMDGMATCPACDHQLVWDENQVNLVCMNPHCKERVISEFVYFFKTMGCEEFSDPTVRKIYDAGFINLADILRLETTELQKLLGKVAGKTVYEQIQKVLAGVPLARYMAALNIFDGKIAETTCQKILDNLPHRWVSALERRLCALGADDLKELRYILTNIKGIGDEIANAFIKGVGRYNQNSLPVNVSYIQSSKPEPPAGVNKLFVCFTGFRDKKLEEALTAAGHTVLNGVTRECNMLVVKDINSGSSKLETARKRGIRIVSREEFENEVFLS